MSYTIGDGMVTFALAGGIIGYLYMKHQSRQNRIEIIHQERMAAMEKGIPLPEFPLESESERRPPDPTVAPILGTVLLSLSVGTMIVLALILEAPSHGFWVAPLPFTFLGVGLIAYLVGYSVDHTWATRRGCGCPLGAARNSYNNAEQC